MATLSELSGILAVLSGWLRVILPSLLIKFDRKVHPISYTGTRGRVGNLFNSGVIFTGLMQIIFISYLAEMFRLQGNPGYIVFSLGSMSLVGLGLVSLKRSVFVHTWFARGYFLLTSIGGMIFSLEFVQVDNDQARLALSFSILTLLTLIIGYFGLKHKSLTEYLGIAFSSLWVLSFYF